MAPLRVAASALPSPPSPRNERRERKLIWIINYAAETLELILICSCFNNTTFRNLRSNFSRPLRFACPALGWILAALTALRGASRFPASRKSSQAGRGLGLEIVRVGGGGGQVFDCRGGGANSRLAQVVARHTDTTSSKQLEGIPRAAPDKHNVTCPPPPKPKTLTRATRKQSQTALSEKEWQATLLVV